MIVGIETDHGLLVGAMAAAGYQIYAINPLAASRYRERHVTSRAKSDAGDAKVLADLVRTDRHNHRPVAGDSELADAIKVLARAHRNLIWTRQRQVNQLRSALREFYPGALEAFGSNLASTDAIAILERAPTPDRSRSISETKVISVLIFDLNESGDLGAISVLGLIMLAITFAVVIAVNRIPGFGDARLRNA